MNAPVRLPSDLARTDRVGQQTAVEQARAVAEVAAAVQVARQFPRELDRVRAEMHAACDSYELAREAFYAVQNRGEGESVHLARELATIWGNYQYGVHELDRNDDTGRSEIQAFAWDVERNSRASRTFIQPHVRMKKVEGRQTRVALTDIHDIYLSNQNTGARAVRECIFNTLPKWYVNEAIARCRETVKRGPGKPLSERAADAVTAFAKFKVTEDHITARLGRPRSQWTAEDMASLEIVYASINRGDASAAEQFDMDTPKSRVTLAEIQPQQPEPPQHEPSGMDEFSSDTTHNPNPPEGITRPQSARLHATFNGLGIKERDERLRLTARIVGRTVESSAELSKDEAKVALNTLENITDDQLAEWLVPPENGDLFGGAQ